MSPKPTRPDYEAIEKKMWWDNADAVVQSLNRGDKNLMKKIDTYVDNFDYPKERVIEKIKTDPMFAATFSKVPNRTGFHEAVAREWLEKELDIEVESLPAGGEDAIYVSSDGFIAALPNEPNKPSKSLDFKWVAHGHTFYAMHKYTRGDGGAQGSVLKEMKELLRNFQGAGNPSVVLLVILDGPFYNDKRMITLKRLTRKDDPCSYAVHIEDVPEIVEKYKGNRP